MSVKGILVAAAVASMATTLPASSGDVRKVSGEVTLDDATGDVQAMTSLSAEYPGRDVVKLRLVSDGTSLTIAATLAADMSGTFANDVVQVFVDTDNDESTGTAAPWAKKTGFEWEVKLLACIEYEGGGAACVGGAGETATAYYAVAKVTDTGSGQALESVWVLPKTPIEGTLVESKVSYADLGVASGQSVRLCARESNGAYDESSYFPEVALTLK